MGLGSMDLPPPSEFESVIPFDLAVKLDAYSYMSELEGWCSLEKAAVLIDLILLEKPRIVVEIGVFNGKSLIPMACALKANEEGKIFGIDPWNTAEAVKGMKLIVNRVFWNQIDFDAIYRSLVEKIEQFNLEEQIVLIRSTSVDAAPIEDIDLLHIDGNHSEVASCQDVTKWVPLVRSGGAIVFNDMTWTEQGIKTTARAVSWLDENCEKEMEYTSDYSVFGIWRKR